MPAPASDTPPVTPAPSLKDAAVASPPIPHHPSSDATSVHSLPAATVSQQPPPTAVQREDRRTDERREEGTLSQQQRRARHRSVDVRTSNRLSGFFTSLIHRRDPLPSSTARDTISEDQPPSATPRHNSENASRSSSPLPPRSVTPPPPPLPPPTLRELGLSLSVLTSDLSPSHFSTPPASGAFLAPHYLLLCHAQGLDVLPLVSPPAPMPYALVRRVSFKSVVVMEQRGVLVAIAGRRDGVRVYALEEVKKAIEWRIDVEVRRERDKSRRENSKKLSLRTTDNSDSRASAEKIRKASLSTPPPGEQTTRSILRKSSYGAVPSPPSPPPVPMIPRAATPNMISKKSRAPPLHIPQTQEHSGHPPPYIDTTRPPVLRAQPSAVSIRARARGSSVSDMLTAPPVSRHNHNADVNRNQDIDSKADWVEFSDDEAIDIVAAGSSGGQALDERTSATLAASRQTSPPPIHPVIAQPAPSPPRPSISSQRRGRPSNLDLTLVRTNTSVPAPEPSPAPTLLTLRQALSHSSPSAGIGTITAAEDTPDPDTAFVDGEEDEDDVDGRISLAQALMESRLPDLPPAGSRRPQQPILLVASHPVASPDDEPSSPRTSEGHRSLGRQSNSDRQASNRRRRWSVMIGSPSLDTSREPATPVTPSTAPLMGERSPSRLTRASSFRSNRSQTSAPRETPAAGISPSIIGAPSILSSHSSRHSRFIPRIISNAFQNRRSDERPPLPIQSPTDAESVKRNNAATLLPPSPPPKLEYVKLPGTKGAIMVKSVETAKKSFLAILCGENGEKVELFAGTYRTALGLSRTFILPDSPRSLELQLQGDDLVEVFLVFSQNVFGLEPATVRVREVRIGRAERRAARRRAREIRTGETPNNEADAPEEDTNVNVSIGVSVAVGSNIVASGDGPERTSTPPLIANEHPGLEAERSASPFAASPVITTAHPEELVAVATAQMGPYTTFQQLSFAPNFPLASIADDYVIPPTYPEFLKYRATHEPDVDGGSADLSQTQFSPPGLPIPTSAAPSRWYYRDPKGVVHGPWKASLMQAWYKDGLLPPDLPVRGEDEEEYTLLKDLRLQSVDPTQPFRTPPVPAPSTAQTLDSQEMGRPLLNPISLLSQPRHFGPPALFFSSRGGHSTAIVDARGRSVLKGRFVWSNDEPDEDTKPMFISKMGDVKRLEALDVNDRAVLIAMRQGGLEAVDLSDALLKPADESRTVLPNFQPPLSNINRRAPFVWRIGTPIASSPTAFNALPSKSKGYITGKRPIIGSAKTPAGRTDTLIGDIDSDAHDEVLFLGRKDDEIYFCERNTNSFRILRLCPDPLMTI